MTPNQILWRYNRIMYGGVEKHTTKGEWLHIRKYENGDLRCTNCKKWLNPEKPEEAKEIIYSKRGQPLHSSRYCPVRSAYMASLCMYAKFHGARRRRVEQAKRY